MRCFALNGRKLVDFRFEHSDSMELIIELISSFRYKYRLFQYMVQVEWFVAFNALLILTRWIGLSLVSAYEFPFLTHLQDLHTFWALPTHKIKYD